MAHFFALQDRLGEVAKQYFAMTQASSDELAQETAAVIKLQSFYRAAKVRERWHDVLNATDKIQRVVRGWLARIRTRSLRLDRTRKMNMHFFHHCSSVIQKYVRGWWSRKHLHDYHGRKQYLQKLEKRADWTRQYLQREHALKLEQAKQDEENRMREEFHGLAGELHHLVSTKSIAGVYNPPYNDALPRAFEKPIEQHLRDSLQVRLPRSLRRPRHHIASSASPRAGGFGASHNEKVMNGHGAAGGPPQDLPDRVPHQSRSASVGKMQKLQGPFRSQQQIEVSNVKAMQNHRTIQSSCQYDAHEHDRKMQQRLSKLTRVSPIDFMAPGAPPMGAAPQSVHTAIPFRDRPVELRGDYVELPKIRDKPPFFTALGGGKHFQDYHEGPLVGNGYV